MLGKLCKSHEYSYKAALTGNNPYLWIVICTGDKGLPDSVQATNT